MVLPIRLTSTLNNLVCGFALPRLITGAQDYHGWAVEIGRDIPLEETGEINKWEAILPRRRAAAFV